MKKVITRTALTLCLLLTGTAAAHAQDGAYCREFTQRVMIGDRFEEAYGTSCLQPDGSWQIINRREPAALQLPPVEKVVYEPVVYREPVYMPVYYNEYYYPVEREVVYIGHPHRKWHPGKDHGHHYGRGHGHHKHRH